MSKLLSIDEFIEKWDRNYEETGTWKSNMNLPGWKERMKEDLEEMLADARNRGYECGCCE